MCPFSHTCKVPVFDARPLKRFLQRHLLDAFGHGQALRHRAAQLVDGLADFGPDLAVSQVGIRLAHDFLAAKFFLGLGGAEHIRREFGAAHVVEDVLAFLQAFSPVDFLRTEPAVKPQVAMVLKNGVIPRFNDPAALGGVGQLAVVRFQFRPDGEAALLLGLLIAEFLAPGLEGEIGLADGDDLLRGITEDSTVTFKVKGGELVMG